MKSLRLARRTVLRGLGAGGLALGLPLLDAMQDGRGRWYRSAEAAPVAAPVRFVFFLFSNGGGSQSLDLWTPKGEGTGYSLSPTLEPLGDMKDRVSVLTGLRHTAYYIGTFGGHYKGTPSLLSGVALAASGSSGAASVDQVIAQAWSSQTRLPSVQAICDPTPTDKGDTLAVSWAGAGHPLPPLGDAAQYFKQLFGSAPGGPVVAPTTDTGREARYRKSVLDYVRGDSDSLQKQLGSEDRQRLNLHLEALRELELQLSPTLISGPPSASCQSPLGITGVAGEARIKAMVQLTVLALQCDLTRVASLMYGCPFGLAQFPWLNLTDPDHGTSHTNDQSYLPHVRYKAQTFASMLRLMNAVQEGDRTLLANSIVLGTSEVGLGNHDSTALPILLAGTAGGRLRTGQHIVYPAGTPFNRLLLTTLQTLQVPATSFGTDGDQPLAGLTS